MEEKLSKSKQKKAEKIKQENIQKFDEEYQKSRIIPKDYKKKIAIRILKNTLIAILVIAYLITINLLSLYLETKPYLLGLQVICVLFAFIAVIYFEFSYRKDSGYLFLHGAEFLVLATITLFSISAYKLFFTTYNTILLYILIAIVLYYVVKTIATLKKMKRQYYQSQSDIKEIIKKD